MYGTRLLDRLNEAKAGFYFLATAGFGGKWKSREFCLTQLENFTTL